MRRNFQGSIQTLQNLPGAPRSLIDLTAARMNADYVLIDMSPGLGAMNQNLFVTSDNFIIPNSPDFFSMMAVDSLARVIPRWQEWGRRAHSLAELRTAVYPFVEPHSKFLGTVIQRYRPRGGAPASAFQSWIDGIEGKIERNLLPVLVANGMVLPNAAYDEPGHRTGAVPCPDPGLQQPHREVAGIPNPGVRTDRPADRAGRCRA